MTATPPGHLNSSRALTRARSLRGPAAPGFFDVHEACFDELADRLGATCKAPLKTKVVNLLDEASGQGDCCDAAGGRLAFSDMATLSLWRPARSLLGLAAVPCAP